MSALLGWYDPMPRPPPDTPVSARATGGIGRLSTWLAAGGAAGRDWIEPVTSLRGGGLSEPKVSLKRPVSLQLAAPNPINEMATTRDQRADRRNAHMVTRSYATNISARLHSNAVNRRLSI
jgi:hypothetical protein